MKGIQAYNNILGRGVADVASPIRVRCGDAERRVKGQTAPQVAQDHCSTYANYVMRPLLSASTCKQHHRNRPGVLGEHGNSNDGLPENGRRTESPRRQWRELRWASEGHTHWPYFRILVHRASSTCLLSNHHLHDPITMPAPVPKPRTLYDKIWDDHVVCVAAIEHFARWHATDTVTATSKTMGSHSFTSTGVWRWPELWEHALTICRHLVHEVTSPQAFEGLYVLF